PAAVHGIKSLHGSQKTNRKTVSCQSWNSVQKKKRNIEARLIEVTSCFTSTTERQTPGLTPSMTVLWKRMNTVKLLCKVNMISSSRIQTVKMRSVNVKVHIASMKRGPMITMV